MLESRQVKARSGTLTNNFKAEQQKSEVALFSWPRWRTLELIGRNGGAQTREIELSEQFYLIQIATSLCAVSADGLDSAGCSAGLGATKS